MPRLQIRLEKDEEEFEIQSGFSIKKIPPELKDFPSLGEEATKVLSSADKKYINEASWCFACNFEDPYEDKSNPDNLTDEERIRQRDENLTQANEFLWRFILITAFKYHSYLFCPYKCTTSKELSSIWFSKPKPTPPGDDEKTIKDFLQGKAFWNYSIKKQQLHTLKDIFVKINEKLNLAGDDQQKFRNSIISAREAFQEKDMANQLLLFTISLENLFNDGHGNINHKMCTRMACFLKSNYEERKEVYDEMKRVYGIRSRISHGDLNYNNPKQVIELIITRLNVRKLACEVLSKFLENEKLWSVFDSDNAWKEFLRGLDLGKHSLQTTQPT